ncbi:hypothetical protein [Burkholderia territorii]|uniref:hypothetical protein n=1 Tax=Burkholderia territorii TaxID=1503055 RepID=UPI000B227660|nr:hypothetical protein [Burkholderia territorii]
MIEASKTADVDQHPPQFFHACATNQLEHYFKHLLAALTRPRRATIFGPLNCSFAGFSHTFLELLIKVSS